jgi:hypothetical protein
LQLPVEFEGDQIVLACGRPGPSTQIVFAGREKYILSAERLLIAGIAVTQTSEPKTVVG